MSTVIIFGAKYLYLAIVVMALVYVWQQPKTERSKILLCAVIALPMTYIVAKIASSFYYDARPFVVEHFVPLLEHANDNGFPSDHTLLSSALAAVIFTFHRRAGFLLFLLAFFVGMFRVLAGIHHWVDILGSMVIAAVVTYLIFEYVFPIVWKRFSEKFLGMIEGKQ